MYVERHLTAVVTQALGQFPCVLVTGPRQAGKTTFLLKTFGDQAAYVSFDDPLERGFALADANGFLNRFDRRMVILDEIQYVPELLPYLKMQIDRNRSETGRWLLTGSQQFQLMKNVSESLAGRVAIFDLLPFSTVEYQPAAGRQLEIQLWWGGYPQVVLQPGIRDAWMRGYTQTYIERDVRQLQNVRNLRAFEAFLTVAAARHGQLFNTAALSRDLGITLPTVKAWAGVLEASYITCFVSPYFKNFGKRLTKTPKLYFLDSGLVCYLTRQPDAAAVLAGPMAGALFEGLVIAETIKVMAIKGRRPDLYFWRSHDGLEMDLILVLGGRCQPVEIELTATPTVKHLEPLNRFKALAGADAAATGVLVCRVDKPTPLPNGNLAIGWQDFAAWLMDHI